MQLSRSQRAGLAAGDRARACIAATGKTLFGEIAWTPRERDIIREHYPNYRRIYELLPHRTPKAIRVRAHEMGVVRRRHIWTNLEVLKLRSLYARKASDKELKAAFPNLRLRQIHGKAWHIRAPSRLGRPFKVLGVPALDSVRAKAREHGLTLLDLDLLAKTKHYFRRCCRRPNWKYINRAVQLFEGTLVVEWDQR
ncbi:hypothetical protein ACO2Q3_22590 [Caulobacter sp. KR2-114]|uniref:hypothetical protein n=1 Tax=Caulobacter sp. KR2-114 TaxID=3400912 RepID=UPI003C09297B